MTTDTGRKRIRVGNRHASPTQPLGQAAATVVAMAKQRTAVVSIFAATALVLLKLVTGVIVGSLGLVSAGIESSGDVVAALLTYFAIRLAGKPPDERHQYGHARAENLTALGEASILVGGGVFVVHEAYNRLSSGGGHQLAAAWYVFAVIGAAIAVDISRTVASLRTARHYRSAALRSNAFHFGADLIGTVAVLVGILLVRDGYQHADAIVALFISALIFMVAGRLVLENARSLMDMAPAGAHDAAQAAIERIEPPVELQRLRIREAAGRHFADVVVSIPATAALAAGHAAADDVEAAVHQALPGSDVVVHVEPNQHGQTLTERVLAAALSAPGAREAHNVTVFELDGSTQVSLHLKLPPTLTLAEGHAVAGQVEDAIRTAAPQVTAVQTHLEPLDQQVRARPLAAELAERLASSVAPIATKIAGAEPRELRFVDSELGIVGFVTLALPADRSVAEAHRIASQIEQAIHEQIPEIHKLVIHTEP
jgi:cation diffusion facilitator family transporter